MVHNIPNHQNWLARDSIDIKSKYRHLLHKPTYLWQYSICSTGPAGVKDRRYKITTWSHVSLLHAAISTLGCSYCTSHEI